MLSAYSDLVTTHSRGLISCPELTVRRRDRLARLKEQLAGLENLHGTTKAGPAAAVSPVLVITADEACDAGQLPPARWLESGPIGAVPPYPVLLDLLEAATRRHRTPLLEAVSQAVALSWTDLVDGALGDPRASFPRWDDIHGGRGDEVFERYLVNASALALAALGPEFGVLLRHVDPADYVSRAFLARLLREARYTGLRVAVHARGDLRPALAPLLDDAEEAPGHARDPAGLPPALARLLAVCPSGLPLRVARRLLPEPAGLSCCRTWAGPEGEPWLYSDAPRTGDRAAMDPATEQALHGAIFDAWEPDGWGYLRRAVHAIRSGSASRIRSQHSPLVHGLRGLGRDYLYRHYDALCAPAVLDTLGPDERTNALIGAARLSAMTGRDRQSGDAETSLRLYAQALTTSRQPVTSYLLYSIANTHASRRDPQSLARSESVYATGFAGLDEIPDADDRLYSEIRLLNGLALVRYLQERDEEALQLERRCLGLAGHAADRFPTILEWARDLINANAAKVYERRLDQTGRAVELLEESFRTGGAAAQEHSRLELARIFFDRGGYDVVFGLLSGVYGDPGVHLFDEPRELLARMMLALSSVRLGHTGVAAAQLPRLAYLCHSAGKPDASRFLDGLAAALGGEGSRPAASTNLRA